MVVSGSYHNKIVYCSLTGMSQVVILSVLGVEPVDVGGVCVWLNS